MTQPRIVLSASDSTQAAFSSVGRRLNSLGGGADALAEKFRGIGGAFAGALSGAAILSAVRSAADYQDEMGKLAQRAGESAEAISALAYAAKLSDVDNQTLARGLRELGNDAAEGGEKLKKLGIDLLDNQGKAKSSSQLFSEVADRIAGIESPAQRAAVAAKIFGDRIGPELLPLLNSGSAGIKGMTDEAARFGKVVSTEAAEKAAEFNDNLTRLQSQVSGITQQMAGPLVQGLATASSYFLKVAGDVGIAQAALVSFGGVVARTLRVDDVGQLQSQARANQNALALTVKQIEDFQRLADRGVDGAAERVERLREQYSKLQADGQRISQALKGEANSLTKGAASPQGTPLPQIDVATVLGDAPKPPKPRGTKDPYAEAQRYLDSLRNQREGLDQLSTLEKATRDLELDRIGKVTAAQREKILATAAEIDTIKARDEQVKAGRQFAIDELEAITKANQAEQDLIDSLVGAGANEQFQTQQDKLQKLKDAFESGRLGLVGSTEATLKYIDAVRALVGITGEQVEKLDELDQFTRRAAENIQDALGEEFANILNNEFDNVGDSFVKLINRMVAEAAAAQLSKYLLGDLVGGGSGDGVLGGIFKSVTGSIFGGGPGTPPFIPSLDVGTDFVPRDMVALIHKGEAVVPAAANRSGRAGTGMTVNQQFSVQGPVDRRTEAQIAKAAFLGLQRAQRDL